MIITCCYIPLNNPPPNHIQLDKCNAIDKITQLTKHHICTNQKQILDLELGIVATSFVCVFSLFMAIKTIHTNSIYSI